MNPTPQPASIGLFHHELDDPQGEMRRRKCDQLGAVQRIADLGQVVRDFGPWNPFVPSSG